jgi:REP element-mobilizing transposase RayT
MRDGHQEHLPRLACHNYQGYAVVHWTQTLEQRAEGWLNESFQQRFRELILHAAAREHLFCPAYCLMPDHLHFIWMGMRRKSDQLNGTRFFRTFLNKLLHPHRLQHQACDNVLRDEQRKRGAFAKVCFYVLENPVRAHLVEKATGWPYLGAVVPGYPDLHPLEESFWETFWKIYVKIREQEPLPPGPPPLK